MSIVDSNVPIIGENYYDENTPIPELNGLTYAQMVSLNVKPLGDQLIVNIIETPNLVKGLFLAAETPEKHFGVVLDVGVGRVIQNNKTNRLLAKPGDIVQFNPNFVYDSVFYKGKPAFIIRESDCFGIMIRDGQEAEMEDRVAAYQNYHNNL